MKNLTWCAVALATATLLCCWYNINKHPIPNERPRFSKEHRIGEAIKQEFEKTKDPALNTVPRERLKTAYDKAQQKLAYRSTAALNWQERGPDNVGGRTRAILFDLNDASSKTVFAAGVSGGLWKTTNIQSTNPGWTAVDDFFDNIAITCIVQRPGNPSVMYFGTGEGWFNSDAVRGMGIWESTDAGATWTALPTTQNINFSHIQDLLLDANGNLYAATLTKGVQRSTDGGISWEQVLGSSVGTGNDNRAADLELAADGTIYATLGIKSSGGIFKSTSGTRGDWSSITPYGTYFNRIELACAPSDANRIYALCQGNLSNDVTHIYRSDDAGENWTTLPVPTIVDQGFNSLFTKGQAWYNLIAAVDPANADVVYIGGVDALRSTNAGANWEQITTWSLSAATGFDATQNIHADHHAIVFAPGSSSTALWGTDGGLYYSDNLNDFNSKPSFVSKNKGYNVTQFYSCAAHPQDANYFLGGTQDNSTRQFTAAGLNDTEQLGGGDGGYAHIDQDNPNIQIISYLYNNYYVSTDGGNTFSGRFFGSSGAFINPSDYDDTANKLYAGNNNGKYLRWNDPAQAGSSRDDVTVSAFNGASPTAILASPNVNDRIYFGLNNGSLVRINNAGTGNSKTGTIIRSPGIGSVSSIAVNSGNENHILLTYSNYGVQNIWETSDAGTSWRNCDGDLPDLPVRWSMFAPDDASQAIIATELGVWKTNDLDGTSTIWEPASDGMANVRVDMLQHRASDNTIIAATHGRGLFSAIYNENNDDCPENFAAAGSDITICDGTSVTLNASGGTSYNWSPATGLTCTNCANPTASPSVTTTYTLTATDANNCTATDEIIIIVDNCPPPSGDCVEVTAMYRENFETFTACSVSGGCANTCTLANDWTNEDTDDIDWRTDAGGTPSGSTGPSADYNPGTSTGKYLYLESSSCFNKKAILKSPCFDLSGLQNSQLTFAYNMYGSTMGSLKVQLSEDGGDNWSDDILIAEGNQYADWKIAEVDLPYGENIIIRIIGTTGVSYRSDMAIDDISIQGAAGPPPCPNNFANAGQNITACIGTSQQLNASGGQTYQWTPTTGLSNPNIANPMVTINNNITYTVLVTDADACEDTDQVSITAQAVPLANAGNNATICLGLGTTLNGSGGSTYSWSPTYALSDPNIANPIATPAYTTTYTLTTTNNGCTATDAVTVLVDDCDTGGDSDCTVITVASPYRENFENFVVCSPTDPCATGICQLRNNWVNEENSIGDQIDWRTDFGGTVSNYTGPQTDFNPGTTSGNYLYLESSGCYEKSAILTSPCFDLSALDNPELEFAYQMYGSTMGDLSVSISNDGGDTWSADFLIASGNQGFPWHVANIELPAGNNVMLRIIGTTGNYYRSDIAIDDIQIKEMGSSLTLDNNAPDGNIAKSSSDGSTNPTSTNAHSDKVNAQQTAIGMTAFPNPVRTQLSVNLQTDVAEQGTLLLYDVTGRKMWSADLSLSAYLPTWHQLDMSGYEAGLYLLVFEGRFGVSYSEKILVQ